MTSFRQIDANRRNARKSTGPTTEEGKNRSRCNAVRHGLTAETVIATLEDASDYQAFEATIIADYDAQSAVERELVLRLASLLWRLRRATAIESALFAFEVNHPRELKEACGIQPDSRKNLYAMIGLSGSTLSSIAPANVPAAALAECFLRLADLPNYAFDRLSRYEIALWRQVGQTLLALDVLDRRKPNERRRYHTQRPPFDEVAD
jgi:hypothetical protein